jgi:hypothetical protein
MDVPGREVGCLATAFASATRHGRVHNCNPPRNRPNVTLTPHTSRWLACCAGLRRSLPQGMRRALSTSPSCCARLQVGAPPCLSPPSTSACASVLEPIRLD